MDPPVNGTTTEEENGPRPSEDLSNNAENTEETPTVPPQIPQPSMPQRPDAPPQMNPPRPLPQPRRVDVLNDIPSSVLQQQSYVDMAAEDAPEAVVDTWHVRSNWRYAGTLAFLVVLSNVALIAGAFWLQTSMYVGGAIAGVGIITFFGTLFSTNRLSNSPDLDKGEFRKALTAAFVMVYFVLIGFSASNRFDPSTNAFMAQLLDHFIWLIGMIVGAYFISSNLRDWQSKAADVIQEVDS
jgi:hypothetical protein